MSTFEGFAGHLTSRLALMSDKPTWGGGCAFDNGCVANGVMRERLEPWDCVPARSNGYVACSRVAAGAEQEQQLENGSNSLPSLKSPSLKSHPA